MPKVAVFFPFDVERSTFDVHLYTYQPSVDNWGIFGTLIHLLKWKV